VRFDLAEHGITAIVLDIEGTTTPIAFVYEVLFPFARGHLREFLNEAAETREVRDALRTLRQEWDRDRESGEKPPEWTGDLPIAAAAYVEWLMDRDRKSAGLKLLQGELWRNGYHDGILKGEVFHDVRPALERWRGAGVDVAIYSSGSVLAQKLLFGTTADGDLTRFIAAFFDTAVGPKTLADSYGRIAEALRRPPAHILFLSDTAAELAAAAAAGCHVLLCVRPGNRMHAVAGPQTIDSFDEIS
jgi:enolase-phosphatase E1